ncbi:uncharacterized protein LOC122713882 [Apis laboriosa]|uniref:uncharacterized protein LOC122713882 n=1 Tax=Apis laboriosa TaxID=183418 RepID=UPI001CC36B6D|nr:uncharacterized protein LOC122713882 [Apis laboriosa]
MGNLVTYPFPYLYKKKQEWQEEKYVKSIFTLDIKKMKEIWSIVERDSMYYGFALCTMIFKTHPEYVKYFEDTSLPYFVQEAKLKKKFRNICEMLCALFLNYDNTSMKNDFLGYIAMVHKDMGLTVFDFENFTSDLLDMLIQELPHMMTKDYIIAQKICYNDVCSLMIKFINRNTKKILEMQNAHTSKKVCILF